MHLTDCLPRTPQGRDLMTWMLVHLGLGALLLPGERLVLLA